VISKFDGRSIAVPAVLFCATTASPRGRALPEVE
jgi:hypothetical protein